MLTDKLKETIIDEILRLSKLIYDGNYDVECECGECGKALLKTFAFTINKLAALLEESITVDDFHDSMAGTPRHIREFYIKLLFVEK